MRERPAFLITIDTEGDNLWSNAREITTENATHLPRFQELCERFGFAPCYLTNYEMAIDAAYRDFAGDYLRRGTAELGMHLHAWNNPPLHDLTGDDLLHKPYLIEYPSDVMRAKIDYLSKLLRDTYQVPVTSHRAGRWAFNSEYARLLLEHGYTVDCSVTPFVSWSSTKGSPRGSGGPDYSAFPTHAYWVDADDISHAGKSALLEVPMTVRPKHSALVNAASRLRDRVQGRMRPLSVQWLRPRGDDVDKLIRLVDRCLRDGSDYLEFMLHSSELMPGGSPRFPNRDAIERLYAELEQLFEHIAKKCQGMTLAGFRDFNAKPARCDYVNGR